MKTGVRRPLETTWEDWTLGGGLPRAFAEPHQPLEVEIGPGDDDFLLRRAVADPRTNWLGIEYSRKRVGRYVQRVLEEVGPIGNLRLAWRPAADIVAPFLSPARVRAYHVHFPDPWPKKHHQRYRLLHAPFLHDLASSLEPVGEVVVLTDARDYAEEVTQLAAGEPLLWNATPEPGFEVLAPGEWPTVFEEQWRREGLDILRIRLRRVTGNDEVPR